MENAYFIQKRDPRYRTTHIRDILREMMLYGDGCTVSGKKDFLVNIGGLLAFKDNAEWKEKAEELLRVYEGGIADGGLAPADLAAMARGAEEMLDDRYIRTRVEQAAFLASRLVDGGVPIVMPPGSHAIFIDARRFLPHLDQDEYPAQRARRRDLRGDGRAGDGARERVEGPRPGDGQELPALARVGAA